MEKKLTNNGPLKESADKHSICTIQPTPARRPAHACAAWPRHVPCMRPWSASTDACLARYTALAVYQTAVAILLVIGQCFTWRAWNSMEFHGLDSSMRSMPCNAHPAGSEACL